MTGSAELLILALVVLLVFGASWLPKFARNAGRAKVEVDKAQKHFDETRAQVVEATRLDKADAALKKANRALNQSPSSLMKDAAKAAVAPRASDGADSDGADGDGVVGDGADGDGATVSHDETVNLDLSDD